MGIGLSIAGTAGGVIVVGGAGYGGYKYYRRGRTANNSGSE